MSNSRFIHVAAAVIHNSQGEAFLARRPDNKHQGGLWEFPGGKVEPGESAAAALARELHEEVGIQITNARPLIQVPYHYPDKSVLLDVYWVDSFTGEPWGKEGQEARWVAISNLHQYAFPAANRPILHAVLLPQRLLITPACATQDACLAGLVQAIQTHKIPWVMLRQKQLAGEETARWYKAIKKALDGVYTEQATQGLISINTPDIELANALKVQGLHLSSQALQDLDRRSDFNGRFLGASCHNLEQLQMAVAKGCDYATLSPVLPTASHPDAQPLGWETARQWLAQTPLPVWLLGGMSDSTLPAAMDAGAQGVAAIRSWWPN